MLVNFQNKAGGYVDMMMARLSFSNPFLYRLEYPREKTVA